MQINVIMTKGKEKENTSHEIKLPENPINSKHNLLENINELEKLEAEKLELSKSLHKNRAAILAIKNRIDHFKYSHHHLDEYKVFISTKYKATLQYDEAKILSHTMSEKFSKTTIDKTALKNWIKFSNNGELIEGLTEEQSPIYSINKLALENVVLKEDAADGDNKSDTGYTASG